MFIAATTNLRDSGPLVDQVHEANGLRQGPVDVDEGLGQLAEEVEGVDGPAGRGEELVDDGPLLVRPKLLVEDDPEVESHQTKDQKNGQRHRNGLQRLRLEKFSEDVLDLHRRVWFRRHF